MKILYIIHDYWPNYLAGTENYTHYIAHEMAKLGHEVFIFTAEKDYKNDYSVERYVEDIEGCRCTKRDCFVPCNDKVGNDEMGERDCFVTPPRKDMCGVNVIKVHKQDVNTRSLDDSYEDKQIHDIFINIFDEIMPDVVHVQHLWRLSINIVNYVKSKNIPTIYTIHDLWLECFNINRLTTDEYKLCSGASVEKCSLCYKMASFRKKQNILNKIYLKLSRLSGYDKKIKKDKIRKRMKIMQELIDNVNLFISPSKYLRDEFVSFGIPKDKIIYSRNGMNIISSDSLEIDTSQANCKDSDMVKFVFTSHIQKLKGIDVLLEACEILQEKNIDNVKIELRGKIGVNESVFLDRINRLKNVEYKGPFKNTDINNILGSADYLILPSIWPENAPLVIDEAYLNNVPCIVSNIGGMAERVTDGVNGLHFKVSDAHDLADKMEYVVKNRELRTKFIQNIPHVKTISENAVELERIYKDMI